MEAYRIRNLLLLLVGLGLLVYLLVHIKVGWSIFYSIKETHFIFLAALLTTVAPIITAWRLSYFVLLIENQPKFIRELTVIEYIHKFLTFIAPFKLNIPAKVLILSRILNIKIQKGISIIVLEYALTIALFFFVGIAGIALFFEDVPHLSFINLHTIFLFILGITLFFCIPIKIFDRTLEKVRNNLRLSKRPIIFLAEMMKTLRETRDALFAKEMPYILLLTFIFICMHFLAIDLLFLAVGYSLPFIWIAVVTSCGLFVGGISTIPGGLGVREATMVLLYGSLGIPQDVSTLVVLLCRLLTIIPISIGYFFCFRRGLKLENDRELP
jgi:uncharacterized protein (TIRG00374 family)